MPRTDPRIDAYIDQAAPFAQPILNHIRQLVHEACPEVEETIKWSFPHFDYKDNVMCSMAAFKAHCAFTFWKAELIQSGKGVLQMAEKNAMGDLGKITSLKDLPADKVMIKMIKEASKLNEAGIKTPRPKPLPNDKKVLDMPEDLIRALAKNAIAKNTFNAASYSHQKEYVQWINEAKTEATRLKRIITTVEWNAEGKGRNWKYEKPK